jgi:hypothetical protein
MLVHFFGSRAYSHAPYKRGNNLTLIGAIALRGMVGEMTLPGAADGLAFKTYVTQILIPNLWAGAMRALWIIYLPTKLLVSGKGLKRLEQKLFTCPRIRQIFPQLKTVGQKSKSFFAHEQPERMQS